MKMDLKNCLAAWKNSREVLAAENGLEHLRKETLYQMALPGGMESADIEELEHLSLCPQCLSRWSDWRRAITDAEELEDTQDNQDFVMSWGMLRAAADPSGIKPVSLKSPCGRFTLGVLPLPENPDEGMITVDIVSDDEKTLDGKQATVRDKTGRVIVRGTLRGGRFARHIDGISDLDLSFWTIIVE